MLFLTVIPMIKLSHCLQFIYCKAYGKSFVEMSFKMSTVNFKYNKLLSGAVPPVGRFIN
jgi:hypothetical protein